MKEWGRFPEMKKVSACPGAMLSAHVSVRRKGGSQEESEGERKRTTPFLSPGGAPNFQDKSKRAVRSKKRGKKEKRDQLRPSKEKEISPFPVSKERMGAIQ